MTKLLNAVLLSVGLSNMAVADIVYFDKPPSAEQLQDAVKGGLPKGSNAASLYRTFIPGWNKQGEPVAAAPAEQTAKSENVNELNKLAMPIYFPLGSKQISPLSIPYVEAVAEVLRKQSDWYFIIEGHTDNVGSAQSNMILSWERAQAVYALLISRHGVDPSRIQPVGKGMTEPLPGLAGNDPKNRRVQFVLMRRPV
jgi:outer membrane protein OmpA-like peptidoglycan-associated protein